MGVCASQEDSASKKIGGALSYLAREENSRTNTYNYHARKKSKLSKTAKKIVERRRRSRSSSTQSTQSTHSTSPSRRVSPRHGMSPRSPFGFDAAEQPESPAMRSLRSSSALSGTTQSRIRRSCRKSMTFRSTELKAANIKETKHAHSRTFSNSLTKSLTEGQKELPVSPKKSLAESPRREGQGPGESGEERLQQHNKETENQTTE
uniref:Uncharacterized protein n=1 Tax=Lotharella globosa TaxID=91324 RepID=A0A7S4E0V8_9EUKA|mmetsp:Transcript_3657/g.7432  ORF Transcript_3657/g.7432 Transcript_3657/m.7432 type:complete len:206 (+) Transcript_3657:102-719(+)